MTSQNFGLEKIDSNFGTMVIYWSFQLFKAQANQTHVKIAGLMSVATAKEFHLNEEILNEITRGKL
mgnify:CR=1 FL=1